MKKQLALFGTIVLCFVLLFSFAFSTLAGSTSTDFGIEDATRNGTIYAKDVYSQLFGKEPTKGETLYLLENGPTITYLNKLPNDGITTSYDSLLGTLSIQVEPYTYMANNGETVTYIPSICKLDNAQMSFEKKGDIYEVIYSDLFHTQDFSIQVEFETNLEIPLEITNEIYTSSFEAAYPKKLVLDTYLGDLQKHQVAKEKYEAYVQYLNDCTSYANYLEKKQAYEEYCAYKAAYDEYLSLLQVYNQWQAYFDFQATYEEDFAAYTAYANYLAGKKDFDLRLQILNSMFTTDSNDWNFYASMVGNTVGAVVDNKTELVAAGCDAQYIDACASSTTIIRRLLDEYANIYQDEEKYLTDYDKTVAEYVWYQKNYSELNTQFGILFDSLEALTSNAFVRKAIDMQGKWAHYKQFLGQMYYITNALDDETYHRWYLTMFKPENVVEANQSLVDNNGAMPGLDAYPTYVEEAEPVVVIEKPQVTCPEEKPVEPKKVEVRIPPEVVVLEPAVVEEASDPGDAPIRPVFDESIEELIKEIQNGTLTKETLDTSKTYSIQIKTQVERTVSIENKKVVTFYSEDGNTILQTSIVDFGEGVIPPSNMEIAETEQYITTFLGWKDAKGNLVDLSNIEKDYTLYPSYKRTIKKYAITFQILEGQKVVKEETIEVPYGDLPVPTILQIPSEEEHYYYRFQGDCDGWQNLPKVEKNATYQGKIEKCNKQYTATFYYGLENAKKTVYTYEYLDMPYFQGNTTIPSDNYYYQFDGWDQHMEPIKGNMEFHASYVKYPLAKGLDNTPYKIIYTEDTISFVSNSNVIDCIYAAKVAKEENKTLQIQYGDFVFTYSGEVLSDLVNSQIARIRLDPGDNANSILITYTTNSGRTYTDNILYCSFVFEPQTSDTMKKTWYITRNGQKIEFTENTAVLQSGDEIFVDTYYKCKVAGNPNCNTFDMSGYYLPGKEVTLSGTCVFGYEIAGGTITLVDGTIETFFGNTFVMPKSEVKIALDIEPIVYHIRFIDRDKVLLEEDVKLGEKIGLPESNPVEYEEEGYLYTFRQWSENISVAQGEKRNLDIYAVYAKSLYNNESVEGKNHYIVPILLIFLLLSAIATGIFFLIRFLKKRKA